MGTVAPNRYNAGLRHHVLRDFRSMALCALPTPCLLLDEDRLRRNVERMRGRLESLGVVMRPHLKTAKCLEVARIAMAAAHGPAMVSTLREAEFFAAGGVKDMIYGVGIAPDKLDRVAAIRERWHADLAIILDSLDQAEAVVAWGRANASSLSVFIEIDADGHRSGVTPEDRNTLVAIGTCLAAGGMILRGVLLHAGDSYRLTGPGALAAAAEAERAAGVAAATHLRQAGLPCPVVSIGSTPTARFALDLAGVTEVRAGVFMFGDLFQTGVGACAIDEIAISVLATVIGHQRAKGWIIVDAGWMALSRDRSTARQNLDQYYGVVCDEVGAPYPNLVVADANQEHGIVALRPGAVGPLPDLALGARLRILPNHACATAAQHGQYHVINAAGLTGEIWPRIGGW